MIPNTFSEVNIEFNSSDSKSLNIIWSNSSNNSYYLGGCRFYTNSYTFLFNDTYWSYAHIDKTAKKEHTLLYSHATSLIKEVPAANGSYSTTSNVDWSGTNIEMPFDASILLKTGSSGYIEQPNDEKSITLEQIDSLINVPNFYNSNYRYIDTLGFRGGIYSGGIMDTWLGETQVITHFSDSTWTLHGSEQASFDLSKTNGDPLYWMTVIMGQEYFQIDMQWMLALAVQETGAGATTYNGTNNEGAWGPWEIEHSTGISREASYPFLFQNGTIGEFWSDTYAELDEAMVINGYMYSIAATRYLYDFLMYSEDACWSEILSGSKCNYFPLSVHLGGYNLGIGSMQTAFKEFWHVNSYESYLQKENAYYDIESAMNKGYVSSVVNGIKNLEKGNKAAATDLSLQLVDMKLSLSDIKRFFYGDNGTASVQGSGGLLAHFDIDRINFNTNIEAAFNKLKGLAPSTQGEDAISLRYDFLTLLRVVKDNFKILWIRPNGPAEWNINVASNSKTGGCSGVEFDNNYPYTEISRPVLNQDGSEYSIQVKAKDDIAIEKVEWSIDSSWIRWQNADYISGTNTETFYQIQITKDLVINSGIDISLPIKVWISATDKSYNSTIDTFSIDFNLVNAEKIKDTKKDISTNILINQNVVSIPNYLFKNNQKLSFEVYNSLGQRLLNKEIASDNHKIKLNELPIPSGLYFIKMSSKIDTKSFKFHKY